MSLHIHLLRSCCGGALGVVPTALLLAGIHAQPSPRTERATATGRLTLAGAPARDMTICCDRGGQHSIYGVLRGDGTFRLIPMAWAGGGVPPGRYRAHLYTHAAGPRIPPPYTDAATSGIEIDIAPDWNDFRIDLR